MSSRHSALVAFQSLVSFLAIALATCGTARAGTFTVTEITDNVGGVADGICGATDCTLRDAIDKANAFSDLDIIKFSPALFGTTTAPTPDTIDLVADLDPITSPVLILGPGANLLTINGSNTYEIFDINDGTTNPISVTVKGVTLSAGSSATNGGCMANNGELLLVEDSVVQNCTAAASGGGIYSNGSRSRLIVRGTMIKNNSAGTDGGGIAVGTTNSNGILGVLIEKCTVGPLNTAQNGGGVHIDSPASPLTIDKTSIRGNTAAVSGGGLYVDTPTSEAPVVIRSSTLSGNFANGNANANDGGGGAFINDPATLVTFENSTISGNAATNESGGGVFVNDLANSGVNNNALLTRFRSTTLFGNTALDVENDNSGAGGGIFTKSDIVLQNVLMAQNLEQNPANANTRANEINQDNGSDDAYSEYSLYETSVGGLTPLPGGGNIQDVLVYPAIAALADYGSGRQTHALKLEGFETAIDRGGNSPCVRPRIRNFDGRGALRPIDGDEDGAKTCDMGAFEFNGKAVACPSIPSGFCTTTHFPTAATLQITKGVLPTANKIAITMTGGALTDPEFFGRPQDFDGTANSFCVYADTDGNTNTHELVASAVLEAGERSSAGVPLWKSTVTSTGGATTYANSLGNADGVRTVAQKTGTAASVTFSNLGANFKFPALPLSIPNTGVVVQNVMSTGNCLEYTFDAAGGNDYVINNALKVDIRKVLP